LFLKTALKAATVAAATVSSAISATVVATTRAAVAERAPGPVAEATAASTRFSSTAKRATRAEAASVSTAAAARTIKTAATFPFGTLFTGTGNIYFKRATDKILAFRAICCFLRFFRSPHRHEGKAPGAIGKAVSHYFHLLYCTELGEVLLQIFFRGTPCEITDE
jgi:hypothetical protein